MSFARALAGLTADLVDLVIPRECLGCARGGRSLCDTCRDGAIDVRRRDPIPRPAGLPPCYSAAGYDGVVRDAIIAHKERGDWSLTEPLGVLLAAALSEAIGQLRQVTVVPIPTSRAAIRARGDDSVVLVARSAARHLRAQGVGVDVVHGLREARRRRDQSGLGSRDRAANLHGAYARRGAAPLRQPVIVVDDIVTTGATLAEGIRAIGVPSPAVVTIAATQRRMAG